jgi:phage protein D
LSLLSDLNAPASLSSTTRQPLPVLTLNGVPLSGLVEAEVTNASHFAADSFRVVLASTKLPSAYGPAYWSQSVGDKIGLSVGFIGVSPTQLILGQVDNIDYDPVARQITLTGRDLSAPLIDTRTSEKFVNQTSSQIAQTLAARHGLQTVDGFGNPTVTPTTTKAGTYYSNENVVLTQDQSEWDLLIYLAEHEGFDVWVSGNTLNFQPSPVTTNPSYKIQWQDTPIAISNAIDLHLSRSETLAKDIIVKVQSWNQKQQKAFTVTYKVTQANKGQRSGGLAQTYSFNVPNLTRDQAYALAKSKAEDITRHERVLTATLPGDGMLTTRAMVQLVGTNTAWDQSYYPDTITRHISFDGGYRMELRAKNHSTQSTVVLG